MKWINECTCNTVHEAVDRKSGGLADAFLHPYEGDYHITNARLMAEWLAYYAQKNVPITIIGDYDADGVCATYGMYKLLLEKGARNIRVRLPRRMSEGYGLSPKIVDEITEGVIVTVDNGIAALEAVKKAKGKGLVVLVVDHHLPVRDAAENIILPEADLIVDPWVDDCLINKEGTLKEPRFRGYCGAGLVYKIAGYAIPNTLALAKISAFAAIATVADVMPLVEDNRNIYHEGIRNIQRKNISKGLLALVNLLQSNCVVDEGDIGFRLAPMINAPGRVYDDGAMKSFYLAACENEAQATVLAEELREINEIRKDMKEKAVERAVKLIEKHNLKGKNPIIIYDPKTAEGIVGLVAGYICETYNVSAFVFTNANGTMKGSARGCEGDHIKHALDDANKAHPEMFLGYGGHAGAAGLRIKPEYFDLFCEVMDKVMPPARDISDEIAFDLEIEAKDIPAVLKKVRKYAPFGEKNPQLVFHIKNFHLVPKYNEWYNEMKKGTVRFYSNNAIAIGFGLLDKYRQAGCPRSMEMVGTLSWHVHMMYMDPQVEVYDFCTERAEHSKPSSFRMSLESILKKKLA